MIENLFSFVGAPLHQAPYSANAGVGLGVGLLTNTRVQKVTWF